MNAEYAYHLRTILAGLLLHASILIYILNNDLDMDTPIQEEIPR